MTTSSPSRASLVAGDIADQPDHSVGYDELLALCEKHGLPWPGMNGALFGGRAPWLEIRGDRYQLTTYGWGRLRG